MSSNVLYDKNGKLVRKLLKLKIPYCTREYYYLYLPRFFVPLVVKNRDYLLGYLAGIKHVVKQLEGTGSIKIPMMFPSTRFIDLIDIDDKRLSEFDDGEFEDIINDKIALMDEMDSHPDNKCDKGPQVLDINCTCGNWYGIKTEDDIPDKPFYCGLCDRLLIDYTGVNDLDILYNQNPNIHIDKDPKYISAHFRQVVQRMIRD